MSTKQLGPKQTQKKNPRKRKRGGRRPPRNKRPRKRARMAVSEAKSVIHFSECAVDYLRALIDPFGDFMQPPCIPDMISIPSFKYNSRTRGVMYIGTSGYGFVSYDPFTAAVNDCSQADACLNTSTAAWAGSSFNAAPDGTTVVATNSTSMFNTAGLASTTTNGGAQIRLVGGAVRITYTGTTLNQGGTVLILRFPSNINLTPTYGQVINFRQTTVTPVTRKELSVNYMPDTVSYISYQSFPTSYTTAGGGTTHKSIGFMVTGVPGITFQVEAVSHFELIGSTYTQSPSHTDPSGFGAAMQAAQTTEPSEANSFVQFKSALGRMASQFVEGSSQILSRASLAAGAAATTYAVNSGVRAAGRISL
jgi:hypothetical protein